MGAPAKLLHIIGLLAKEESTYGTPVSLTTTADGVQLQYKDHKVAAPITIDYAFDGNIGPSVSNLGQTAHVPQAGRSAKGDLPFRTRPAGVAYSSSIVPAGHRLIKGSGFDATVTTGVGTEKWTYTPSAPGVVGTSLTLGLYTRGELWSVAGAVGSLKFDAPDPAPPIWTWGMMGILPNLPTDASAPSITYPLQTIQPLLASSIVLTLGNLSANAVVMSSSFDMQSTYTPRVAQSGGAAHLGFVMEDRKPIMKVVLEATALTTTPFTSASAFDPYNLRESGTTIAASLVFGSVQYFRQKINFPQCQVIDAVPQNNGSIATVELTLAAFNSTASSADDVNIVFD
jgi:hypothetical protein